MKRSTTVMQHTSKLAADINKRGGVMNTSSVLKKAMYRFKPLALGSAMATVMALPTTAFGWDMSTTPLFWDTKVEPNVVLMLDNSGSMQSISTNEAFKRYKKGIDGSSTLANTSSWYWCTGYNNTTKVCTGTSGNVSDDFTVRAWKPPASSTGALGYYIDESTASNDYVALCDVSKAPGATNFYIGKVGSARVSTAFPTSATVGVLVSNQSGGGGSLDSCVRWKMATTGNTTGGYDYSRYYTGTVYKMDNAVAGYGKFLLNKLIPAKQSYNFDNNTLYPVRDPDSETWDAVNDPKVIPDITRMEAAREAGQQVVVDFFSKMNIGLFVLNGTRKRVNVPDIASSGTAAATAKSNLISTTESLALADLPASALDGSIGTIYPSGGTPLGATMSDIKGYYQGSSSPIKYRCQKSYAIMMTDGIASDSGLDTYAEDAYTQDARGSSAGNDLSGKSFQGAPSDPQDWSKQNVITYTVGFGLEDNLLRRTPLVNRVNIVKSDITGNKIKLTNHGLSTGDYFHVVSNPASGLTADRYYYVVRVDNDYFKLAGASSGGDSSGSTTNNSLKAEQCAAGGATSGTTGPCLPVSNGGGAGPMVASIGPGKSFFPNTPEELTSDLGKVFNSINNLTAAASAVSTNSKQLGSTTLVYQARFNTEDWSGDVAAYSINTTTGAVNLTTPAWTTKSTLSTQSQRGSLFTWNTNTNAAAPFSTFASIGSNLSSLLNNNTNALQWLQGYNVAAAGFRSHSVNGLMGDVINADPVFVGALNFGFHTLPASNLSTCTLTGTSYSGTGCTGAETYKDYYNGRKTSATPMLFVGANDGQIHTLNANTGVEIMAYFPAGAYQGWKDLDSDGVKDAGETEQQLYNLTQTSYDHRYFVDGAATTSDAFIGNNWKTFFVGSLGAGGRSVYSIDVSDSTFAVGDFKWEFTHANLGLTFGKPAIVRFPNNNWYAVFANGLNSYQDKASIFVVNVNNAADWAELTVSNGDSPASPNGMMSVGVALNSARTASVIYGGDMKGNIWKFNVTSSGPAATGTKLFTAGDGTTGTPQSITGGLRIGKHPAGGNLVFFGTGKYFENVDRSYTVSSTPQIDSFYAVQDNGSTGLDRGDLQVQTLTTNNATGLRTASTNSVDYASQRGWYIDLTNNGTKEGERVVAMPVLSGSRIIFPTIIPSGGDRCVANGTSWLMEFNALDGKQLDEKVLDTNGDGKIDAGDAKVAGMRFDGMVSEPSIIGDAAGAGSGAGELKVMGSTSASKSIITVKEKAADSNPVGGAGRMSWQQIQ